ncbi:MAG TPA: 23S rRNA (guanosine(2251)-2'-O)-methyltransferase RlmB, partial [Bacteroidota bacterium]|nr:23S rRNA (guanosine(2251)-2'-O)-methyltransferase RlmB [Bacteroidota bacterium]
MNDVPMPGENQGDEEIPGENFGNHEGGNTPSHTRPGGRNNNGGRPRPGGPPRNGGHPKGGGHTREGGYPRSGERPRNGGYRREGGNPRPGGPPREGSQPREREQVNDERPQLRTVHDRKPTADIIAGRQPVMEALRAGRMIEKIVILFGVKGNQIEKIKGMAKSAHVPVVEVGKQRFRDLVSDTTTQGVVAIVGTKSYVEVEDIIALAKQRNELPFILILDEIEDPHNLGALIRTAEAAGVHGVVIPKHHAAAVNQTVVKTSSGASEYMLVAKVTNVAQTIDELKKLGFWIFGADAAGSKMYNEVDFNSPVALIIGNEGHGVRRLVKDKCDVV